MLILIIRTTILYIFVIFIMRMMGKRQIGQLEPFELVIAIMVSELASLPMQDNRMPLIHALVPIITLLILQVITSLIQLKSEKARELITGRPSVLIKDGKIDIKELKYQRFNINDLLEDLRLNGYFNLSEIAYAILETSGQLSIIPKTEVAPLTRTDLKIKRPQEKLPITLILDGKINTSNLEVCNKNLSWLQNQLKANNITSEKEVFIALLDSNEKFFYQLKERKEEKQ